MATNFVNIASITINSGSTAATVNGSEDLSLFREGDLIFTESNLPLIIASISNQNITLREAAEFTLAPGTATIVSGQVRLAEALNIIEENNQTWSNHFGRFITWLSTDAVTSEMLDASGTPRDVSTPFALEALIVAAGTAATDLNALETRVNTAEADLGTIETTLLSLVLQATNAKTAAETAETGAEAARTGAETAETGAEAAQGLAETAQGLAETARTGAQTAQTGVSDAQTAAETAQGLAETARTDAQTAKTAAETAQGLAEAARNEAQTAKTASETAETGAQTAQGLAETAETAAQTAQGLAEIARTEAQTAKTAAETAETGAEAAQTAAETAQGLAETARTDAQTAKTAAETAQGLAETARTDAQTAKTAAETAQAGAEATEIAAQTAKTDAETAETGAQTAQGLAEAAKTAAETAQTAAETAQGLAETAETGAETAKTAAETAQGLAETARTGAQTAQGLAETANISAETAETGAETARDLAEDWADKSTEVIAGRFSAKYWSEQAELVAGTENYVLTTRTINNQDLSTNITLDATDVGLENVDNTSDADKPISTATQTALDSKIDDTLINAANGLAPLGADSKIPVINLPDSFLGALVYSGVWDAETNTPDLTTIAAQGIYYKVSTAGTTDLSGILDWNVGDWVVSNGTTWDKIDNTDAIISVAGKTGVVTLSKADVGLSNVNNTSDTNKPISTLTQAALNNKVDDTQVLTNVPTGAVFTDTTYSVGDGGLSEISFTSADNTKLDNIAAGAEVNVVDSVAGKTGVVSLVKSDVGLSNVDNSSDANKPVSTAQQTALDLKANTTTVNTNTSNIATNTAGIELAKTIMSKADFFALSEKRIRDNAGSGFAEWGKNQSNIDQVNEGISIGGSDILRIGRFIGSSNLSGMSRTGEAIASVNGVNHSLAYINSSNTVAAVLEFPLAPDGTKTYDSATGAVVTHATSNEAFEGVVINGDFRDGTTGWSVASNGDASVTNGVLTVTNGAANASYVYAQITTEIGKTYRVEVAKAGGSATISRIYIGSSIGTSGDLAPTALPNNQLTVVEFTSTTAVQYITLDTTSGTLEATAIYNSISVMPATESVITTRQDFVFLESFHEAISDKDVVYPLGNVQYGATTWEGISLSTSLVAQGYSAFGEWDTTTTGHGVTWSTLSAADKVKFLQDPENNIYNDDGELIQVRYRMRVVEGLGDDWLFDQFLNFDSNLNLNTSVLPRGIKTDNVDSNRANSNDWNHMYASTTGSYAVELYDGIKGDAGIFGVRYASQASLFAHNGLCFAIPIALVQRLNQGAYHPVYNPEGTANYHISGVSIYEWYNLPTPMTSLADCMSYNVGTEGSISGGATFAGRPTNDPFLYYDAIYAGQVQDLRTSSNRQTTNELLNEYSRKGIAGTIRGKESVPFTFFPFSSHGAGNVSSGTLNLDVAHNGTIALGDIGASFGNGTWYPIKVVGVDSSATRVVVEALDGGVIFRTGGDDTFMISASKYRTPQYETLPWQDIIGDPTNIAATFPDGVYGQWIPVIPDSTSKVFEANKKNLLSGTVKQFFTNDDGATWLTNAPAFDNIINGRDVPYPLGQVTLWTYPTPANPYVLANNAVVIGELGDVFASNYFGDPYGASLNNALLGKVAIGTTAPTLLYGNKLRNYVLVNGYLDGYSLYPTEHEGIPIGMGNAGATAPTVKTFPYITSENSQYYLQWVYKEMIWDTALDNSAEFNIKSETNTVWVVGDYYHITDGPFRGHWYCVYDPNTALTNAIFSEVNGNLIGSNGFVYFKRWDGNGFGDDNKFNIVSGESTVLDDNGNAVLIGQKRVALPFFTGKS